MAGNSITGLEQINADATVLFGDKQFSTPHLLSISVRRVRGELVGKARFSYKTNESDGAGSTSDAPVVISWYGTPIFAGYAKRVTVAPDFQCSDTVIVTVEAEDVLNKLANKRINRRQKQNGLGPMAFITSIHKRPFVAFDDPNDAYDVTGGRSPQTVHGADPRSINGRFVTGVNGTIGDLHPVVRASDVILNRGGTGGGSSLGLHDHSSLDTSGPFAGGAAHAVFGVK